MSKSLKAKSLRKRTRKFGLPPGTLIQPGASNEKSTVQLIRYDEKRIEQLNNPTIYDCLRIITTPSVVWLNICGIDDASLIGELGKGLNLHPLMLEDIMTIDQRPKFDDYRDTLYIVMKSLTYDNETQNVFDEQVSLILGSNYVISFLETPTNVFNPVIEGLQRTQNRMRKRGADFLCYSLMDCIVDQYFMVLERVDAQLDGIEEELMEDPTAETLSRIQHKKREISTLRKSVWPLREVINRFQRKETALIKETTKLYVQDIHDHTIQAIETIEGFRDISNQLLDTYMSTMTQKMNEVIKVLTIVATIFVPLTFIASLYGMNFKNIPELNWEYGYYYALSLMFAVACCMVVYFMRKKWI